MTGRGLRGLAAAAALLAASACAPLYLPPVPRDLPPLESELRLSDARVDATEAAVEVSWIPQEVEAAGWLDVQWFPPAGGAVASESVWLSPEEEGARQALRLPPEVSRRAGRWRAILSFEGRVLRQLDWTEPP